MALPWIKLYTSLPDHPKSDVLGVALGVDRAWTHVVELWLWVARMRPDGHIGNLPPELVAKRAGWTGDATRFMDALRFAGFLDEQGQLHGWVDTQSAHAEKLQRDAERARVRRGSVARRSRDELRTSHGRRTDGAVPSRDGRAVEERRGEESRREDHDHERAQNSDEQKPADRPAVDPNRALWATRPEPIGMHGEIPADVGGVWGFKWRDFEVAHHLKLAAPDLDETARWDQTEDCLNYRFALSEREFRQWLWPQGCIPRLIAWLERANRTHLDGQTARARAARVGVHVADTRRT